MPNRSIDPEQLGHGTSTGLFFARVNLGARSACTRQDRDLVMGHVARGARTASDADEAALLLCDDLAQRGEEGAVGIAPSLSAPPWL